MANATYYLKVDTVPGEVKTKPYQGWIELESWSWGSSQYGGMGTGTGSGTGKVAMQDFHFVMLMNNASATLAQACATGRHIPTVTLVALKDGNEFLRAEMKDVLVSSYQTGGSSHGEIVPTDQISMNYAEIKIKYTDAKSKP